MNLFRWPRALPSVVSFETLLSFCMISTYIFQPPVRWMSSDYCREYRNIVVMITARYRDLWTIRDVERILESIRKGKWPRLHFCYLYKVNGLYLQSSKIFCKMFSILNKVNYDKENYDFSWSKDCWKLDSSFLNSTVCFWKKHHILWLISIGVFP